MWYSLPDCGTRRISTGCEVGGGSGGDGGVEGERGREGDGGGGNWDSYSSRCSGGRRSRFWRKSSRESKCQPVTKRPSLMRVCWRILFFSVFLYPSRRGVTLNGGYSKPFRSERCLVDWCGGVWCSGVDGGAVKLASVLVCRSLNFT